MSVGILGFEVMQSEVCAHAKVNELGGNKLPDELELLRLAQLARESDIDLAQELRVLPLLRSLHRVPQNPALFERLRRPWRQQDFGVKNLFATRVVVDDSGPLIDQQFASTIGRTGNRACAIGARYDLGRKMKNCHQVTWGVWGAAPAHMSRSDI